MGKNYYKNSASFKKWKKLTSDPKCDLDYVPNTTRTCKVDVAQPVTRLVLAGII